MANHFQSEQQLQGVDIAKLLRDKGPIVKCVLLRATTNASRSKDNVVLARTDQDPATSSADNTTSNNCDDLIEEIELDTTPKKNEVETNLGGPFTFVGQYEDEGIVLMARRGWIVLDEDDEEAEEEKEDETNDDPPEHLLNPHKLQPPFDTAKIYGDILVLKVAEMADPLDDNENDQVAAGAVPPTASNEEFFLNYTKESWLRFAARTDVVAPTLAVNQGQEDDEEVDEDDEEAEEEVEGESDDEDDGPDEADTAAMMQLLMTNVLKQFRERHGRGPSSEEVLLLRKTVAEKLGITPSRDDVQVEDGEAKHDGVEDEKSELEGTQGVKRERKVDASPDESKEPNMKKVKFGDEATNDNATTVFAQ